MATNLALHGHFFRYVASTLQLTACLVIIFVTHLVESSASIWQPFRIILAANLDVLGSAGVGLKGLLGAA